MKSTLDCYSCFICQGLQAARMAGADETTQDHVVRGVMGYLLGATPGESPVELARGVQTIVRETTGVDDPFRRAKAESNQKAREWTRHLEALIQDDESQALEKALRIAIAGNIIDYGPSATFDLDGTLKSCLEKTLAINHLDPLRERLAKSRRIAYLADNAGEIVFDQILISLLIRTYELDEVIFVVRESPFLNDALNEDATAIGIQVHPEVNVVCMGPGIPKAREPNHHVWQRVQQADLRIAKGQANAEALDEEEDFFLLFMVKCELMARALSEKGHGPVQYGEMILFSTSIPAPSPAPA